MAKNREPETKPEESSEYETDSGSGSGSESEPEQPTPVSKPLTLPPATEEESESLSGSESESETDSSEPDPEPVSKPPQKAKPTPVLNTPVKRVGGKIPESPDAKKVKKAESVVKKDVKKDGSESVGVGGEESSKKLFARVFSEDDEISLLKGMLEFVEKKKADPIVKIDEFLEFVKSLLRLDVTKAQLLNKMKRLKSKYRGNASKGDVKSSKKHERESYELSKKIWGDLDLENENGLESKKVNGSVVKKGVNKSSKGEDVETPARDDNKVNGGNVGSHGVVDLVGVSINSALEERIMKEEIKNVGKETQKELGKKLREIEVAELELCAKRCEYVAQKARLMIAAKKTEH